MSVDAIVRDAAERLWKISGGIEERGGEGSADAARVRGALLDALSKDSDELVRDAIRGIYSMLAITTMATDEEYQQGKDVMTDLPDDLVEQISKDLKGNPGEPVKVVPLRTASEFDGAPMRFVWYPFIPCGEYSIMAAAGGSGKGMCACLLAAYISRGLPLPEDTPCPDSLRAFPWRIPQNVLFISSEDTGNQIRARLGVSHADLDRVFVVPKEEAAGLEFSTDSGLKVLEKLIKRSSARLVIIDPMQGFIGGETDMNRTTMMRTILAGISRVAGATNSGILLIAHTSKKAQETDLNGGILGSVETVNAARSVMCIMRDPEDENPFTARRLILHTKANNARLARSIRFEIHEEKRTVNGEEVVEAGGRFSDDLYSDVTKEVFEEAVRRRVTARELLAMKHHEETEFDDLVDAIREKADELRTAGKTSERYWYTDFDQFLWAGKRPADALNRVAYKVIGDGIALSAGITVKRIIDGRQKLSRGVKITLTK